MSTRQEKLLKLVISVMSVITLALLTISPTKLGAIVICGQIGCFENPWTACEGYCQPFMCDSDICGNGDSNYECSI